MSIKNSTRDATVTAQRPAVWHVVITVVSGGSAMFNFWWHAYFGANYGLFLPRG